MKGQTTAVVEIKGLPLLSFGISSLEFTHFVVTRYLFYETHDGKSLSFLTRDPQNKKRIIHDISKARVIIPAVLWLFRSLFISERGVHYIDGAPSFVTERLRHFTRK
jgi:hypothetical protein